MQGLHIVGVALLLGVACGPTERGTSVGGGLDTDGGYGSATASESTAGDGHDSPLSDEACAAAGGAFGVLSERSLRPLLPDDIHPTTTDGPGLVVGAEGLYASVVGSEEPNALDPFGYGVRVTFDGVALAPTQALETPWVGGQWWQGVEHALVTHCRDRQPGWSWVDAQGNEQAPTAAPPGAASCNQTPAAAWTSSSSALVAWLSPNHGCGGGSTCARVVRVKAGGPGPIHDLFDAGDPGPGTTVSIAAGPSCALVAELRFERTDIIDIVTVPVGLDGMPLAPPRVVPLPPSPESTDRPHFQEARVTPDNSEGFYVYIGGWGHASGRMHLDCNGEVLEPLIALPPVDVAGVSAVFDSLDRVAPRPGGAVAIGTVTHGGGSHSMVSALDVHGDFVGHVVFLGSTEVTTATDGTRLWALSRGFMLSELGCVLP